MGKAASATEICANTIKVFFAGFQCTPQVSIASDGDAIAAGNLAAHAGGGGGGGIERRSSSFDISPSAAARSLLSKLSVRKPSILSISSNASSPGANERKNSSSQEELAAFRREFVIHNILLRL